MVLLQVRGIHCCSHCSPTGRQNRPCETVLAFAVAGLPHSVQLSYAILDGFQLPDPSGAQGLIPAGLLGAAAPGGQSSLSLRDVRIVVDEPTLQQHVSFFSKLSNVAVYTVSGVPAAACAGLEHAVWQELQPAAAAGSPCWAMCSCQC